MTMLITTIWAIPIAERIPPDPFLADPPSTPILVGEEQAGLLLRQVINYTHLNFIYYSQYK